MKTRTGFVSNSSSANFIIPLDNITKPQLAFLMSIVGGYMGADEESYNDQEDKTKIHIGRGMVDDNDSLFAIFKGWNFLRDHNIKCQIGGDGLPNGWEENQEESYDMMKDEVISCIREELLDKYGADDFLFFLNTVDTDAIEDKNDLKIINSIGYTLKSLGLSFKDFDGFDGVEGDEPFDSDIKIEIAKKYIQNKYSKEFIKEFFEFKDPIYTLLGKNDDMYKEYCRFSNIVSFNLLTKEDILKDE